MNPYSPLFTAGRLDGFASMKDMRVSICLMQNLSTLGLLIKKHHFSSLQKFSKLNNARMKKWHYSYLLQNQKKLIN